MRMMLGAAWAVLLTVVVLSATGHHGPCRLRRRTTVSPGDLALTCDLFAVAVGAGLTPLLALDVAVGATPPGVAERLGSVHGKVTTGGARLADALQAEASRSPDLRPLLELLTTSERSGSPIAPLLGRLATEQRTLARHAALARARKVPVRLLFPLVFLLLPAFLVLTVAPALLAGMR